MSSIFYIHHFFGWVGSSFWLEWHKYPLPLSYCMLTGKHPWKILMCIVPFLMFFCNHASILLLVYVMSFYECKWCISLNVNVSSLNILFLHEYLGMFMWICMNLILWMTMWLFLWFTVWLYCGRLYISSDSHTYSHILWNESSSSSDSAKSWQHDS